MERNGVPARSGFRRDPSRMRYGDVAVKTYWLLLLGMALPVCALAGESQPSCYDSPTQAGLNACASSEFAKADQQLNAIWKAILVKYKDRPAFLEKLKASQKLWLQFRDAEIAAHFPLGKGEDPATHYGSIYPMCVSQLQISLTQQRIQQLQAWLSGAQEGDACAGSIKNSADLK
jgi:uncharacterized protein YecT (DUF1311 family)